MLFFFTLFKLNKIKSSTNINLKFKNYVSANSNMLNKKKKEATFYKS